MPTNARSSSMDALELLEQDHRTVEQLFEQFQETEDETEKGNLAGEIIRELSIHAAIEEMIFYPAVRESVSSSSDLVDHSLEEHQEVKEQLDALADMDPDDPGFDAKVSAIMEAVEEHVEDEEGEMFPKVRAEIDQQRLEEMGRAMEDAKGKAPTRPHPMAPNEPPGNVAAGMLAGIADRARDAVKDAIERRSA